LALAASTAAALLSFVGLVRAYELPNDFCHTFKTDLSLGNSGTEVVALTQILADRGYLDDGHAGFSTYDALVAQAVSAFQETYKSAILTPGGLTKGNGRTGPATRAKLNQLYSSCPIVRASEQPTLTGSAPTITSAGVSIPGPTARNGGGDAIRASVGFTFTLTNNYNGDIYVEKDPRRSIATVSSLDTAGAYVNALYSTTDNVADTTLYFDIAPRASRQFQAAVLLDNSQNPNGSVYAYVKIPRILYSTSTPSTSYTVDRASLFTDKLGSNSILLGI